MGTLHENVFTFMTIHRRFFLRMRNVSNKICNEYQNTHFMFSYFSSENRAVYDIIPKNIVQPERMQIIWRLRVAYRISKPTCAQAHTRVRAPTPTPTHTAARTNTHTLPHAHAHTQKYVIIIAFPRQQWLQKRASILRLTHAACLMLI